MEPRSGGPVPIGRVPEARPAGAPVRVKAPKALWCALFAAISLVALCQPAAGASSAPYGWYEANGHRLFLDCAGTGQPTVVLESGLGSNHYSWDPVNYITGVVGTTVCVYDRYGQGSSDSPPGPGAHTRTIDQAVSDLHVLLRAAGLDAPYVLVGTSMGGLIVREYARLFPKAVAGMVLLDSAPDDWDLYTGTETFTYAPESFNIAAASAALRRSDNLGSRPLAVLQAGDDSSVQSSWAKAKKDFQGYWELAPARAQPHFDQFPARSRPGRHPRPDNRGPTRPQRQHHAARGERRSQRQAVAELRPVRATGPRGQVPQRGYLVPPEHTVAAADLNRACWERSTPRADGLL